MSLLEDVFLEDEAGEAQDLERVIDGDELDDRPRSRNDSDSDENSAKEDEAEEEKRRVDPTSAKPQRVSKNPRFVLNPARLTGPRGIQVLPDHFKDFKFKGKGHEKNDLDLVLKKLEHWAYRLYPKFQFEDCLKKIETLGKKRPVSVHLTKLRMNMLTSDEPVVQRDSSDDELPPEPVRVEEDEFDKLLQQQIQIARTTPAPNSVKKTPFLERSSMMLRATSSPSINDEQRERMLRNRRMAEERRLAKLKHNQSQDDTAENSIALTRDDISTVIVNDETIITNGTTNITEIVELDDNGVVKSPKTYVPAKKHRLSFDRKHSEDDTGSHVIEIDDNLLTKSPKAKKHNRSRIDSSDDDDEPQAIDVEKHSNRSTSNLQRNGKPNDKNKVTYLLDDDNEMTIDDNQSNKKHRSSVIDSSDEDEPITMNESISVDIHYTNDNHEDIDSNISNLNSNKNTNMENTDNNTNHSVNIENKNSKETIESNKTDNNSIERKKLDNEFDKLIDSNENVEGVIESTTVDSNVSAREDRAESVDNEENKIDDEGLMDVDFGDDF